MAKIFETQFHKGSYIDRISKVAGTNTAGVFRRAEKGLAWIGDGLTSKIELNQTISLGTVFSFECVLKITDNTIIYAAITGHSNDSYPLTFIVNQKALYTHDGVNAFGQVRTELFDQNWHHVIVTRNGTSVYFYIDNIAGSEGILASNNPISIDQLFQRKDAWPLKGYCSNIKIYDHILSTNEHAQAYLDFLNSVPLIEEKYPKYGPWNKPTSLDEEGLVLAWNMIHSTGGVLVDISGNGNNGTINGPISSLKGLVFDGVDDYAGAANLSEIGKSTSFTVTCRVQIKDITTQQVIWGNGNNSDDRSGITIESSRLAFESYNGVAYQGRRYIGLITGVYNLVCVGVNNTYTFYINGVEISTETFNGELSSTTSLFTTGAGDNGISRHFNGVIEDLKVYNYAFTEAQAKDYHNSFASRVVLQDNFLFDPVGAAVPMGWRKGTGTYVIDEYVKESGQLIGDSEFTDSGWWTPKNGAVITGGQFISDADGSYLQETSTSQKYSGKRYRVVVDIESLTGTNLRVYIGNFVDGMAEFTSTGVQTLEFNYIGATVLGRWVVICTGAAVVNSIKVEEIPPLSGFVNGTKYLECTTAGKIAIPNPFAYGTPEFYFYKKTSSLLYLYFISNKSNVIYGASSGYVIYSSGTEDLALFEINTPEVLVRTADAYIVHDTWYGMKPPRTKDGEFTLSIKGGAFGNTYTLIDPTGGSGTNPVTNNLHKTSNYLVLDLDVGDRFILKPWLEGVLQ